MAYCNLFRIFAARKLETAHSPLGRSEYQSAINSATIQLSFRDKTGAHMGIFINPNANAQYTAGELAKVLIRAINTDITQTPLKNLIVVTNTSYTDEVNVRRIYDYMVKAIKSKTYIEVLRMDQLVINWPESAFYMPHEVIGADGAEDHDLDKIKEYGLTVPSIKANDPGCTWIGARVGDYVRIHQLTGGTNIRHVVAPLCWIPETSV